MPLRLASPENRDRSSQTSLLQTERPQGHGRRSPSSARSHAAAQTGAASTRDALVNTVINVYHTVTSTVQRMTILQRVLAGCALVIVGTLGLLFMVFNERIFHALVPFTERWKQTTGGWIILWALLIVAAFPPMIGYSTLGTLTGFVYGAGEGWLILASATVVGSFCALVASRTVLRKYVERMVAGDKRFAALSLTLKHDGLKLLCMIRLCPLPFSITNGALSTFPTVDPFMYALATAIVSPKLFIHVFIGSRLAAIARSGGKMSAGTRAINYISIIGGVSLGIFTGWFIYQKTIARAQQLEAEELANARKPTQSGGNASAQFTDDPEAQAAATLAHDDEDGVDWFDDAPSPKPEYSDTRSEDSFFGQGDGSSEEAIGMKGRS